MKLKLMLNRESGDVSYTVEPYSGIYLSSLSNRLTNTDNCLGLGVFDNSQIVQFELEDEKTGITQYVYVNFGYPLSLCDNLGQEITRRVALVKEEFKRIHDTSIEKAEKEYLPLDNYCEIEV